MVTLFCLQLHNNMSFYGVSVSSLSFVLYPALPRRTRRTPEYCLVLDLVSLREKYTHPLTHIPTHPLTLHPPTNSLTHPLTHSHIHSFTHSHIHPPTNSLTHSSTHSLTHPLIHSLAHLPDYQLIYQISSQDETLVHCSLTRMEVSDFTFEVEYGNDVFEVYVRLRPHFHAFLERVSRHFEVRIQNSNTEFWYLNLHFDEFNFGGYVHVPPQ